MTPTGRGRNITYPKFGARFQKGKRDRLVYRIDTFARTVALYRDRGELRFDAEPLSCFDTGPLP